MNQAYILGLMIVIILKTIEFMLVTIQVFATAFIVVSVQLNWARKRFKTLILDKLILFLLFINIVGGGRRGYPTLQVLIMEWIILELWWDLFPSWIHELWLIIVEGRSIALLSMRLNSINRFLTQFFLIFNLIHWRLYMRSMWFLWVMYLSLFLLALILYWWEVVRINMFIINLSLIV